MEYDPKLTVEGIITAIGVVIGVIGAVVGFLVDLWRRRAAERRDKRQRADRLTIMEALERDLVSGLTENQIKEAFRSDETKAFRSRAGATNPSKLTDEDFARYLRDLQWNHMIDQLDIDRYCLRSRKSDLFAKRDESRQITRAMVGRIVDRDKLVAVIQSNFDRLSGFEKEEALELLAEMGASDVIQRVASDLESPDPETALASARALVKILR